jgi:hypothetical protein
MSEQPENPAAGGPKRRDEEIALEMMKFIATTTGYGKTPQSGAGFQGGTVRAEDYARSLLELYGLCLDTLRAKNK